MKKQILVPIVVAIIIIVTAVLISKILFINKPKGEEKAPANQRVESAPKEEKELFDLTVKYQASGDLLNLRDTYQKIMAKFPNSNNIQKAQDGLEGANIQILFSLTPTPDSVSYEVQEGDTLSKIAKKFSTTQELILKANGLKNPGVVPLGRKLKVHKDKFSIVVDKSQNILTLKEGDGIVKTYHVSTGINNSTPVGKFKVVNRITNPPWYTAGGVIPADSPKNILGTRWLGISVPGYGIHGTTEPQSIGKQVTSGCVRMKNADVEELYSIVPEGTEVIIVD